MFEPAKNSKAPDCSEALILLGRDGEIRTHDPLHPMQVRYRAALHPEKQRIPLVFGVPTGLQIYRIGPTIRRSRIQLFARSPLD